MTEQSTPTPPIVCDMTDARDTLAERVGEYERLFGEALVGREHTDTGIRFRFRADPGVEDWVRDLALVPRKVVQGPTRARGPL